MSGSNMKQNWDANLYDGKLGFVAEFGKGLLSLLEPQTGEKILDLGCGTGDLTAEIAACGAVPVGLDMSTEMIFKAQQKYPNLRFLQGDGESFQLEQNFDAVFSNAALHWMKKPEKVIESVRGALRQGGRFTAEFGGKGNVQTIVKAISTVLEKQGVDPGERNPWYFPSIGEYAQILENQGFRLTYAAHFDRPTPLKDGENGLDHWLNMFGDSFFKGFSEGQKDLIFTQVKDLVRPQLFHGNQWIADYKRIRILAIKE
ncbi:class I SAM-dependent methyltransferase [Ammoniphilus resinae]|uniref:Trans-aconitate methyltransferase n=1 Tax=Ammoniphilus resinae TaxID=861532 RepID=A0ABS4GN09_9BACL|nr:class I SAM-dependent methyltransferase [Ammoniphilus resinae]MBP1931658.1 trans-aconitate methyltransferase [Ammoniphilus resinae]